jgi:hypothetical protein
LFALQDLDVQLRMEHLALESIEFKPVEHLVHVFAVSDEALDMVAMLSFDGEAHASGFMRNVIEFLSERGAFGL